jgi:predicted porin
MKKTLIALAVLAVSSAAMAQSSVSLTGKLRFAYGSSKADTGAKSSGVGVTDGDWNIAAVEDLGGGLKAGANMSLRLRGRDAATDAAAGGASGTGQNGARPRDSSMYLTGGFGTVTVGAVEAGNAMWGGVTAGAPTYIGLDNGTTLQAASNTDILQYTSPTMSGVSFKLATLDAVGANGAQNGGAAMNYGLNYANGPFTAALDYTSYGSASASLADSRTRISASYDLGVARIGVGMQNAGNGAAADKSERAFGVSVPMGPWLFGAVYASSKTDGATKSNTGYDLAAQYNLSKRTYVALQSQSTTAATATQSATTTRIQLAHSF